MRSGSKTAIEAALSLADLDVSVIRSFDDEEKHDPPFQDRLSHFTEERTPHDRKTEPDAEKHDTGPDHASPNPHLQEFP